MHRRTILSSVALVAGVSALAPADGADAAPTGEVQRYEATRTGLDLVERLPGIGSPGAMRLQMNVCARRPRTVRRARTRPGAPPVTLKRNRLPGRFGG